MALTLQELMAGQQRLAEKEQQGEPVRITRDQLAELGKTPVEVKSEPRRATEPSGPLAKLVQPETGSPSIWSQMKESALMGVRDFLGVRSPDKISKESPEAPNQRIFEEFSKLVLQQQDLMLDATKEQTEIFKKLEATIEQLKTAGKDDSLQLRKSIDALAAKLKTTPRTNARGNIERAVSPKQQLAPSTKSGREAPARAEVRARSAAVPAMAIAPLPKGETPLYEDAGTISSESEGDKVQTGEREADMGTILGFLGNLLSGGGGGGLPIPFGNPFKRGGPRGGPVGVPGAPGELRKDTQGRWRDAKGRYAKAPAQAPGKGSWWNKVFSKAGAKGAAKLAGKVGSRFIPGVGWGLLGYDLYQMAKGDNPFDFFGGDSKPANTLEALEAEHKNIEQEMYKLVTEPSADRDQTNARINELNEAAAENMRKQNAIRSNQTLPQPAAKPDSQVLDKSMQNKELTDRQNQSQAPVVINNTTQTAQAPAPTFIGPTPSVRPTESALEKYIFRESRFT